MMLNTTDVVALASLLFWFFVIFYVYRNFLKIFFVNYSKNISVNVVNLEKEDKQSNHDLMRTKLLYKNLDKKLQSMNDALTKERLLIEKKFSAEMQTMFKQIYEIKNFNKNYRIQKEKMRIEKYIIKYFNLSMKDALYNKKIDIISLIDLHIKDK